MDKDYILVLLSLVRHNTNAMDILDTEAIDEEDTIFIGDEIRRVLREEGK